MEISNGKIIAFDYHGNKKSYVIDQIRAEFEEDMPEVIGVLRCTGITIESNAPSDVNSEAEAELYNEFADIEYNDANGDGSYMDEAKEDISNSTGVAVSKIEIEEV